MIRVILAEDDPAIRDVVVLILERSGCRVDVFPDGAALLEQQFDTPDIFILDKQLGGVDGLDVCRFLKAAVRTRHIPVIMLSASPHIGRLAKDAGADDALEKPFRMELLREMIRKYT